MPSDDFLSKEEILIGLPAKRARTLLFLIENRTGLLAARSRRAMDLFSGEETARELDTAFLESFMAGREPPEPPTIRDLERFAPSWAHLVPENPRLRAALAQFISERYAFTPREIPRIRLSLGLDQEVVQSAFQNLYHRPLASIYRPALGFRERLRSALSRFTDRIESLPPFWTSFSLTLTETVGAAILALPIALARVGPLFGVLILIVLGLVNVLTIGFMSEAIARSGMMRYGNAFLGQIISDYLGPATSIILSTGLTLLCFLLLPVYYIGFSTTMADATRIPPWLFTGALFALGMYYTTRKSLTFTVTSALVVGGLNIFIILFLSLMAFSHLNPAFLRVRELRSILFDPSLLEIIFGVVLTAYFGHLSICNCGRVVLQRDPSGRSLIWGSMASMTLTIVLYSLWVLAVNGSVEPGAFEGLPGTAFTPLAQKIGPIVHVLGSIFVVLGLGMVSVHFSLSLSNLVGERLPTRRTSVVLLPRLNGRVIFHHRREAAIGPRISLTYLGLEGSAPRFLLETQKEEMTLRKEILPSSGTLDLGLFQETGKLSLEVLQVQPEFVRLRYETSLAMTFEGDLEKIGMSMAEVLDLPEVERRLFNRMLRGGEVSLDQAAAFMAISGDQAAKSIKTLIDKGFVMERQAGAETVYRASLGHRRASRLPDHIWRSLDPTAQTSGPKGRSPSILSTYFIVTKDFFLGERGRLILRISPIAIAFLLTEWMFYTGHASFSKLLNFVGVIVVPLLSGVFPVLMLASSRRKGEYMPGGIFRLLGHPSVLTSIYLLFLASLFVYGLFIWHQPLAQGTILLVGIFIPVLTFWIIRNKGFVRRIALELRWLEKEEKNHFKIMSGGEPLEAEISLTYPDRAKNLRSSSGTMEDVSELKTVAFTIPTPGTGELKITAHRIKADGSSTPVDGTLEIKGNGESRHFDLKLTSGSLLMAIEGKILQLAFKFHGSGEGLPDL